MHKLDAKDRAIIQELQRDGRIKIKDLSDRVGLSVTPCQLRLKKLQETGVIVGFTALVDHAKLETFHIAFVQVTMSSTHTKALEKFNAAVRNISEVEQCHMIAGGFDYLLKVRTKDIVSFRKVLGNKISELPNVKQTSSFVSMENVKDIGV